MLLLLLVTDAMYVLSMYTIVQIVIDEVGCAGIEPLLIPPQWAAAAEVRALHYLMLSICTFTLHFLSARAEQSLVLLRMLSC
jgi:hypothetical protein